MSKKPLKLYWCKSCNFGDDLNAYIFKKCFDIEVKYSKPINADAFGIGSIGDRVLLTVREIPLFLLSKIFSCFFSKKPCLILSTGLGAPFAYYSKKGRFLKSTILKRNIKPVVLRGKRTKEEFEKLLKLNLDDVVLGDFGLLASALLDKEVEKKYDLGICPHFSQKDEILFKKIALEIPNSIILDPKVGAMEFLEKLAQCKTIASSAMHPLIAADSLAIPNLWVTIKDFDDDFMSYKTPDYYSVFGLENLRPVDLRETMISPEMIIQQYQIDKNKVEDVKRNLLQAIKKALKDFC